MDADERLDKESCAIIREELSNNKEYGGFHIKIIGQVGTAERNLVLTHTYPRLFINDPRIRFEGSIHEQIMPSLFKAGFKLGFSKAVIEHLGYAVSNEEEKAKYERNLQILLKQVEQYPNIFFVHYNLGKTYIGLHRYEEGIEQLYYGLQCPDAESDSHITANAHFVIAQVLFAKGNFKESAKECLEAIKYDPNLAECFNLLGEAYYNIGEYESAAEAFEQAINSLKKRESGLNVQLADSGSLKIDVPHFFLGLTLSKLGKYDQAIKNYEQALKINPERTQDYIFYADALSKIQQYEKAIEAYKKYLTVTDSHNPPSAAKALAYYNWAVCLIKLGKLDESEAPLRQAIDIEPNLLMAGRALASLLVEQNRNDEAKEFLINLSEIVDDKLEVLRLLKAVCQKIGDWRGLINTYQMLFTAGENPSIVMFGVGQTFERLGDKDKAIKAYEKAVELDPQNARAWIAIAQYCYDSNNISMAKDALLLALNLGTKTVGLLNGLGEIYYQLNEPDQSQIYFEEALNLDPQNSLAKERLQSLYFQGKEEFNLN